MSKVSANFLLKLKWFGYRLFDQIGLLGRGGLFIILISTILFFMNWRDLQQQIASTNTSQLPVKKVSKQIDEEELLQKTLLQLPKLNKKTDVLNRFMQLAKTQKLTIDVVKYKTKRVEDGLPVSQTSMEFTLYATYPQIHAFLNSVMIEMPYLSIENLSFNNISDEDAIEAHIKLLFNFAIN